MNTVSEGIEMSTSAMHRGIVVGVDGSPAAAVAVDWAASDAALRNVPLTLVHVYEPKLLLSAKCPLINTNESSDPPYKGELRVSHGGCYRSD